MNLSSLKPKSNLAFLYAGLTVWNISTAAMLLDQREWLLMTVVLVFAGVMAVATRNFWVKGSIA